MPIVTVIDTQGVEHRHEVAVGQTLMQSLAAEGFVDAVCGGAMSCGTCAVAFDENACASLPKADEMERELLDALGCDGQGQRLSCQLRVSPDMCGMVVRLLPSIA